MPLAALILAAIDEEAGATSQPLLLTLGGQTLLERMVWQACRIGCRHVVLCAGPLPAAMMGALDRLRGRGIDIKLARSPREAADLLHPEEQVLVFANTVVLQDDQLNRLTRETAPAAFILPESWGRDRFERIDAVDNWAGVALLNAPMIRETVAMLGEWAFAPTLLRRAVQQGVVRVPLGLSDEAEADEISPIERGDLTGTARVLARSADVAADGLLERHGMMPGLRRLAAWVALKPVSAAMLALSAILFFVIAAGLAVSGFDWAAFLLLLPATAIALLTILVGQSGMPEPKPLRLILNGRAMWLPILLFIVAARGLIKDAALPLALLSVWLAVQSLLLVQARSRGAPLPQSRPGVSGEALILAISFAAGWPFLGLGLCLLIALSAHISVQQKAGWR